MKRKYFVVLILAVFYTLTYGSNLSQTVRGRIIDNDTKCPLPGASVILIGSDPLIGTISDLEGYFSLRDIPVGRQSLKISYMGYQETLITEIIVSSAKEVVLTVSLIESVNAINEVTITPGKGKLTNEMLTVSSRSFNAEETKRYPAAISDLGRMAIVFPGVSIGNEDANNEIIIRGNSSNGLLWRMEGVEIPNPNHFAIEGSGTGYVSMLSSSMLNGSNFMTGAFPADYGNALSGVFDIKLRNGNNQRREYGFQVGLLGVDLTAEGPFSRKYNGSYLLNLRYSTMGLLAKMGWDLGGDRYLSYADLSFKLHLPTKRAGNFSLWGFGGPCSAFERPTSDTVTLRKSPDSRIHHGFRGNTQAVGLTHIIFPNDRSYFRSAVSYSENGSIDHDSLCIYPYNLNRSILEHKQELKLSSVRASILYNTKINKRLTLRTGINISHLMYNYWDKNYLTGRVYMDSHGMTQTIQAYIMSKYRCSENLEFITGMHYMHLRLNGSKSIEPRISLKWNLRPDHSLGFGLGKHSRHELISTYMTTVTGPSGSTSNPNRNLDLTKALHFVIAYNYDITRNLHFHTELYYQWLYHVPVLNHQPYGHAPINDIFPDDTLFNRGTARNYGIELSLEKYFSDGYYFLVTSSIFSSMMNPGFEDRWYHTKYDARYVQNLVGGKEFQLGKNGYHFLGVNAKLLWSGGMRGAHINTHERIIYINECFEEQYKDYFRIDASIYLKINNRKTTHSISFDVQNITDRNNINHIHYDPTTGKYEEKYMTGLVPVISYRVEF